MRDPFANYDRWLEQPYQDMYADAEREEARQLWIEENSTYETDCCGVEIPYDDISFGADGKVSPIKCPTCGEIAGVDIFEASLDDYDVDDYDDDDYFDEDAADRAADDYFNR